MTLPDDGARHQVGGPFLGSGVDTEEDGQPSAAADGDDLDSTDDEDGVNISGSFEPGSTTSILVTPSGPGLLNAWIDWNGDGNWSGPGEQVATDLAVGVGNGQLSFQVPEGATPGTTFARFRISSAGGESPTGASADGEVEDHQVTVSPPPLVEIAKRVSDGEGPFVDADTPGTALTASQRDAVEFQLIVTNPGLIPLSDVAVDDPDLGVFDFVLGDLAPGESITVGSGQIAALAPTGYCDVIDGKLNSASVIGLSDATGTEVTDSDDAFVNCVADDETTSAGGGQSFDVSQPSTVLHSYIRVVPDGLTPAGAIRWSSVGLADGVEMVKADGRALSRTTYAALFGEIGTIYGPGDGSTTFNIPDLRGRAVVGTSATRPLGSTTGSVTATLVEANLPSHRHGLGTGFEASAVGSGQPFSIEQPTIALNHEIIVAGIFPSPGGLEPGSSLAEIVVTAGTSTPRQNAAVTNGAILPIADNQSLFSILGSVFGGDGETSFALPDLRGRLLVGQGQGPGLASRTHGMESGSSTGTLTLSTMPAHTHVANNLTSSVSGGSGPISLIQPELVLRPIVALVGVYPVDADALNSTGSASLGELVFFAGNYDPSGWVPVSGQSLLVADNQALFALLGTVYGGDGEVTFGLPDLRGRTMVGAGVVASETFSAGEMFGSDSITLSVAELAPHIHPVVEVLP